MKKNEELRKKLKQIESKVIESLAHQPEDESLCYTYLKTALAEIGKEFYIPQVLEQKNLYAKALAEDLRKWMELIKIEAGDSESDWYEVPAPQILDILATYVYKLEHLFSCDNSSFIECNEIDKMSK